MKLEVTRQRHKDFNKDSKVMKSNIFVANIIAIKQNAVAEKSFNLSLLSIRDLRLIGVRAEQDVGLRDEPLEAHIVVEFLVRVNHVELRDIVAFYIGKARIRRNLPEGRSERERVATEFGATRIGDVFTLARDGKARERAEEIPDGGPYQHEIGRASCRERV